MKHIQNTQDLIQWVEGKNKSFLLLYKSEGSLQSQCALDNLGKAMNSDTSAALVAADVTFVRDIHGQFGIDSIPTLVEFNRGKFFRTIKGCHESSFYKNLFQGNHAVLQQTQTAQEKPQKNVAVYSTPTCSWCNTLKSYLKDHQIRFSDIDVSRDAKAAEEMVKRSGQQGVPQTTINSEVIVGFDKARIDRLLGIQSK